MIQPKIQYTYLDPSLYDVERLTLINIERGYFFTPEEFETFKREFGKELLEKAANNADGDIVDDTNYSNGRIIINKESITSILDEYLLNNKI